MKCAVMQPTYLPWVGYFVLINSVDNFVFYDDAQYSKGSWHNRNKIIFNNEIKWLTVPVLKPKLKQSINSIAIDFSKKWQNKQLSLITQSYKHCNFFQDLKIVLDFLEEEKNKNLSELNICLIKLICKKLNFTNNFFLSSDIKAKGGRSEKIINICKELKSNTYLSTIGAKNYLDSDGNFNNSSIKLEFFNFIPKEYNQKNLSIFNGYLSIIDIIANIGWDNLFDYINKDKK